MIEEIFERGVASHRAGKFEDAERLYRTILQKQPNHADANHNLGVLAVASGKAEVALPFFKRALQANRTLDQFWFSYICCLITLRCFDDASRALVDAMRAGVAGVKLRELAIQLKVARDGAQPPRNLPLASPENCEIQKPRQEQLDRLLEYYQAGQFADAEALAASLIERFPRHQFSWKVMGAVLKQLARGEEALVAMQKSVELSPEDAEAHCNLGAILKELGRLGDAEISQKQAIALAPGLAEAHSNLGNIFQALGRPADAAVSYLEAIGLKPEFAEAHSSLGNAFKDLGRLDEAEASCLRAIALRPNYVDAHINVGNTLKAQGRLDDAEASYNRAIALQPSNAVAHNNLGNILRELGRLVESEAHHVQAIALKSDYAKAYGNLGNTLKELGKLDEAEVSFRKAITLKSDYAEAHNYLAVMYTELGRLSDAEDLLVRALALKNDYPEACNNLGNVLREQGRLNEAESRYKQALALKSDFAAPHSNLGTLFVEMGRQDEAREAFGSAFLHEPDCPAFWFSAHLHFSRIQTSRADTERERKNFLRQLGGLKHLTFSRRKTHLPLNTSMFYLAYHNFDDTKAILEELQRTIRGHPSLEGVVYQSAKKASPERYEDRIKIGICSNFLCDHTIGRLYSGLIQNISTEIFDVVLLIPCGTGHDDLRESIELSASKTLNLSSSPLTAAGQIDHAGLDVLFYPDIGMSPFTYQLALSRLAPVQVTSWGHPITTGLDTMDYFVSSKLLEPAQAQDNYSERLILLSRLPTIYEGPASSEISVSRQSLGLPEGHLLIGIPQSLFKFHPDFDVVLETIMVSLPDARIVLIEDKTEDQTIRLKQRWSENAPHALSKSIFLARISREKFLGLLDTVDLLLDPIYFGSGNTFYEAMMFGTPIVTYTGDMLSGRVVTGGYNQMQVVDPPVANSIAAYIELCVKLGSDLAALKRLKAELRVAAQNHLFGDEKIAEEFGVFFCAAVDASRHGRRLPQNWQPAQAEKTV